jgi:predicted RNA-binding protein YlqC (UPF0109 family)
MLSGSGEACWEALIALLCEVEGMTASTFEDEPFVLQPATRLQEPILKLNSKQTGCLLGRGGCTISKLRAALPQGALVTVVKDQHELDAAFRTSVLIQCSPQDHHHIIGQVLAAAYVGIQPEILRDTAATAAAGSTSTAAGSSTNSLHASVTDAHDFPSNSLQAVSNQIPFVDLGCKILAVPLSCIGQLIGRGGSNISRIRSTSGAAIHVAADDVGGMRMVTVSGSAPSQASAAQQVQLCIQACFMQSAAAAQPTPLRNQNIQPAFSWAVQKTLLHDQRRSPNADRL